MDVKDYCRGVEQELTIWKARLFDLQNKIDGLPSGDKQRMHSNIEDLRILVLELNDKIDRLRTECPLDWSAHKNEIDESYKRVSGHYEEAMNLISPGDYGG